MKDALIACSVIIGVVILGFIGLTPKQQTEEKFGSGFNTGFQTVQAARAIANNGVGIGVNPTFFVATGTNDGTTSTWNMVGRTCERVVTPTGTVYYITYPSGVATHSLTPCS